MKAVRPDIFKQLEAAANTQRGSELEPTDEQREAIEFAAANKVSLDETQRLFKAAYGGPCLHVIRRWYREAEGKPLAEGQR